MTLVFGLLLKIGYLDSITPSYFYLLTVKSAGVILTVLLLTQSIDQNNSLILKLCSGNDKKNCSAILNSKAAVVFKGLSWSEVGFFYFAGTFLVLLFCRVPVGLLKLLSISNVLALPYTLYSIYYQLKVAKQWCILCCAVQAVLWLEFLGFLSFSPAIYHLNPIWNGYEVLVFLTFMTIPAALWLFIKPLLLLAKQVDPLKEQLKNFKYNKNLFNSLLKSQTKYNVPTEDWSISLGNSDASNIITMVSNPFCPPCARTHKILDEWLTFRNDFQVRFIFTADNTESDSKTVVARHFMALNDCQDKATVRKALHDWYEQNQKNYEVWAKKYPVQLDEKAYFKLNEQSAWCTASDIKYTPTFLLNGYKLPESYQIQDIKYLLE